MIQVNDQQNISGFIYLYGFKIKGSCI